MAALGWLLNLDFAGGGVVVTPTPDVQPTGAPPGLSKRRRPTERKYPRYIFIGGERVFVRSWQEEQAVIAAYRDKLQRQQAKEAVPETRRAIRKQLRYTSTRLQKLADAQAKERKAIIEYQNSLIINYIAEDYFG